ncbi:MAG TPA: response regulator [Rhodospirillales bacterium]
MDKFNLSNLSVLVVDDYAPMRKILMSVLRELGVNRISQSPDGEQALKFLKNTEPDVIMLDAIMEPMGGLEFARRVRAGEGGANPFVPIVMISGQAEQRHILAARDAGITEFLAKPISAHSVYSRLCSIVKNPRAFIRTDGFFGPDRRRIDAPIDGPDRRKKPHEYPSNKTGDDDPEAWPDQDKTAARDGRTKNVASKFAGTKAGEAKSGKTKNPKK